ncbi:MAG: Fic family protein [Pelodictyon phaeoclathratiforme]
METHRAAGYEYFLAKHRLQTIPNWQKSFIGQSGTKNSIVEDGYVETIYPASYWPGDRTGDHLEFALKYDGINLATLCQIFEVVDIDDLCMWIQSKPTGRYARKIWFLYEFLTGKRLPLEDIIQGNYVKLLEEERYYTASHGENVQRYRIVNNLLGTSEFCPVVRRTEKLANMEQNDFFHRCKEIVINYHPELLKRALNYLYTKETKSSFEIEHITPSASRTEKFIALLATAEKRDFCTKDLLINIQNTIVDQRFQNTDYRKVQNYVSETISPYLQKVHYICPKPEDLPILMEGLLATHHKLKQECVHPIIHASIISYGFVFLHPFEDGNGRIHRFLIHNILSRRGAVPKGIMFPVSAAILKNPTLYNRSLESYSTPLLQLIDYELDEIGHMTVSEETGAWYRYIDMTTQAEALYAFVMKTIEEELKEELDFLVNYDNAKRAMQDIVDMPDHRINLFIRLCLQNNGRLSAKKRESHFSFLTNEEVDLMQDAVRKGYQS